MHFWYTFWQLGDPQGLHDSHAYYISFLEPLILGFMIHGSCSILPDKYGDVFCNQMSGQNKILAILYMYLYMYRILRDLFTYDYPYIAISISGLRLPSTCAAKIDENQTPLHVSLNNSVNRPSFKNLRGVFWPSSQRCQKCVYIFKVTSIDRAEIQNGGMCCFWILLISALTLEITFQM